MTLPGDPNDPRTPLNRDPDDRLHDGKARKAAKLATIIAAVAAVIALIALIIALAHDHDAAPSNCDPSTDYVCEPETVEQTGTVDVPTTSMSPTEVPVPTVTPSETVTTTVVP